MHLALYCFANGQLSTALKLLYRARYLLLLVCGEDHPEMALLDVRCLLLWNPTALQVVLLSGLLVSPVAQSNIGLVLHGVMEYELSLRFLENALTINTKYHGNRSLKVALRCTETRLISYNMWRFPARMQLLSSFFFIYSLYV